jgi:hypothetical protein
MRARMAIDPRQRAASYAQTVTGRSIRVSTRRRRMRKQSRVDRNIDIAPSTGVRLCIRGATVDPL